MGFSNCNYLSLQQNSLKDSDIVRPQYLKSLFKAIVVITKPNFQIMQFLVSVLFTYLSGQTAAQQLPRITQLEEDEITITLDGFVDEPVWRSIPAIDGMKSTDPDTLEDAKYKTEIRFFYTQRGLYFGIVNHQPAETIISRLTAGTPRHLIWLLMR